MHPECIICLEPLDPAVDNAVIVTTKCGHLYHQTCIFGWMEETVILAKCPQCRQWVFRADIQRVFMNMSNTDAKVVEELREKLRMKEQELREELQKKEQEVRDQLQNKEQELAQLQSKLDMKHRESSGVQQLKKQLVSKTNECEKLKAKLEKRDDRLEVLKERLANRTSSAREDVKNFKTRITSAEREKKQLEKRLSKVEEAKDKLQSRLTTCQKNEKPKPTTSRKRKGSTDAPESAEAKARKNPTKRVTSKPVEPLVIIIDTDNEDNDTANRNLQGATGKTAASRTKKTGTVVEKPHPKVTTRATARKETDKTGVSVGAAAPRTLDVVTGCTKSTGAIPKVRKSAPTKQ